jgi:hypothetical protein
MFLDLISNSILRNVIPLVCLMWHIAKITVLTKKTGTCGKLNLKWSFFLTFLYNVCPEYFLFWQIFDVFRSVCVEKRMISCKYQLLCSIFIQKANTRTNFSKANALSCSRVLLETPCKRANGQVDMAKLIHAILHIFVANAFNIAFGIEYLVVGTWIENVKIGFRWGHLW